jgi:hypothetical protein
MLVSVMLSPFSLLATLAGTLLDRVAAQPKPRSGRTPEADVVPIEVGRRLRGADEDARWLAPR